VNPSSVNPAPVNPAAPTPAPRRSLTPAQMLESLRARVARGEARLKQFDLEGFRFIKPNLATCHLLLNMEAELGSEEGVLAHFRRALVEAGPPPADELNTQLEEYRRLLRIAHEVEAEHEVATAA
ncbi:MAG TPA: hypothetical protein DDY91_02155, partial [Planctomycetaceae bacterium]|nr:hypothetical protein [Planctomycetaceae bacterium]